MTTLEREVDVIASNLANASSAGFKRILVEAVQGPPLPAAAWSGGAPSPLGAVAGMPVALREAVDEAPGQLHATGSPLDAAVDGPGYFLVQAAGGIAYTRDGRFRIDPQGRLVTSEGDPVLGQGGVITLPAGAGSVRIQADGSVVAGGAVVDRLRVALPPGPLEPLGGGLYRAAGQPRDIAPRLAPGEIEGSNVEPVREMVGLIRALRAYESAQQVMQTEDSLGRVSSQQVGLAP
jgi:flagellar basal-body rod protein FlgF